MSAVLAQITEPTTTEAVKQLVNRLTQPASFFVLSVIGLLVVLAGYRSFSRPKVALAVGLLFTLGFALSLFDPDFQLIVTKADNVPIVMMIYTVAFFTWLALRQAAVNDTRLQRGEPLFEAGADDKVLVWPDLVYTELIAMVIGTALLIVWTILLAAPLEQPADPVTIPNPSKAPWYFLGLQELLVYFDPWIAGVLLPGLIIFGLCALPYIDRNPRGNGYYTFKERPFAILTFMFGFLIMWVLLIVFGTFLRGPNWNFFGPYEYWDPQKPVALVNVQFYELFWVKLLGRGEPASLWVREAPGVILLALYFFVLPAILAKTLCRRLYRQMGLARYTTLMVCMTWMTLVPIKMVLRWTLDFKYFVNFREFFFNI